jgi:PAS domain S-box-containing protein
MKQNARRKHPLRSNQVRVLLVEGNPEVAPLTQEHLKQARASRYHVRHVQSLDDALALLPGDKFDLLLLDMSLIGADLGALSNLLAAAPNLPCVLLCEPDAQDLALVGVRMGAQDFLPRDQIDPSSLEHAALCAIQRARRSMTAHIAADDLRIEHERLVSLLANIDASMIIYDSAGHLVFVNDCWVHRNGIPREAILGRRYDEITGYPMVPHVQARVDRVLASGDPFVYHELLYQDTRHPDGIYIDGSILPMLNGGNKIIGAMAISIDVTEKVRARQEVETQRSILETILAESPVGVVLFDRQMRLTHLNAEYARIAGLDPDTARGLTIYDYFPGARRREALHRRVLDGEDLDLPNISHRDPRTGQILYYDVYYRPVANASGEITGVVGVVVDVTERRELERQKDNFLALASHELRTPVTAILGFAQLSARSAARLGDERLTRSINVIEEQAAHLSRIVNDLLDVSRIESGGAMPVHIRRFDLGGLVGEATRNLQLAQPGFHIAAHVPQAPALVDADPHLIAEVVSNLMDNAVKYSRDDNRIEVEVKPNGKEVLTSVRDYGVGIPPEQRDRVFDRFYRASNASSLPRNGLGLGLYLAREIVTRHGGRIWCESTQEIGSIFYFTLPLIPDPLSPPQVGFPSALTPDP